MKILVCAKVCDGAINPFDESAIECALRLSSDVTVISMAPPAAREVLEPLTRLGAKVVLISDRIYAGSDTLATSYILAKAIKKYEYDLILCGRQSIDGDTAQVGPMLAQMLGLDVVTNALEVAQADDGLTVSTRTGTEKHSLPLLVTMERTYMLRFPSIFSKLKQIEIADNTIIGCDEKRCGLQGSPTRVVKTFENETGRRKCAFITFDELYPLIERLKKAGRSENKPKYIEKKLKEVWAVGEEVCEKAAEIAENVVLIEKSNAAQIARRAMEEKPEVILWNADLWGRMNAPIAAAILQTGLCADCTQLETDGERLFMYRPAKGGNITAKILCRTLPQTATVRTESKSSDIVVAGGKGVFDKMDKIRELAEKAGGTIGASRGLVDMNKIDYKYQIGLTGKTISPLIYIAVGISGAIQHTCGIEGAKTVIAINPDKNARIFDYADYGIIDSF